MIRFVFGLVNIVAFCVLTGIPLAATGAGYAAVASRVPLPLALGLLPVAYFVFVIAMLLLTWALRALIPDLEPGHYAFPAHRQAQLWTLHLILQRVVHTPLWREICFGNPILRWLALRALGCSTPFDIDTASNAMLLDVNLLRLGKDCVVAFNATITCHYVKGGRISLGRVVLGDRVQLLGAAAVFPDTQIGNDTTIGLDSALFGRSVIGQGVFIGSRCSIGPKVSVGDRAVIGNDVVVEPEVTIEAGAVVAAGTRVAKGTVVRAAPPRADAA